MSRRGRRRARRATEGRARGPAEPRGAPTVERPARPNRFEIVGYATLATIAVAVRVWSWAERSSLGTFREMIDSRYYLDRAAQIASGELVPPHAFFMSPLYPYLLAWLGEAGSLVLQIVAGIAGLFGVATAARVLGGRGAGLATFGLGALAGPLVLYDTSLLPDGPTSGLLGAGLGLLMSGPDRRRSGRLAAAGACFALAVALRSNALTIPLLLACWLAWRWRRRLRDAARPLGFFLAPVAVVLLLVSAVNLAAEGLAAPLSYNGGLNLYIGNNPAARGTYTLVEGVHPGDPAGRSVAEARTGTTLATDRVDRYWRRQAIEFMIDDPGRAVALWLKKLTLFWSAYEIPQMENLDLARLESTAVRVSVVGFGLVVPLAFVGGLGLPAGRRALLVPPLLVLGSALATTVVFFVNGRIRLPAWPAILPLAGCGVTQLVLWIRTRTWRRAALAVGTALLVALVAHWERVPRRWNEAHSALRYAVIEGIAGNLSRARAWIDHERALEVDVQQELLLPLERGAALYVVRDYARAFEQLRQVADAWPENIRAQQGMLAAGQELLRRGRSDPEVREAMERARSRLGAGG